LRKFCNFLSVSFSLLLGVSGLFQVSQAQVVLQDRITQPVESSSMSPLTGSLHPMARAEFDQGLADNSKVIQGMSINFKRSPAQEASLAALLKAQQDPGSPYYHKWLTQVEFGQQFGMSSADLDKVTGWLQAEGFTVTSVAASKNAIGFSGNIANVEKAFQTKIHNYSLNGETHFANADQLSVPSSFVGTVSSVRGLDDFRLKPRVLPMKTRESAASPHFTSGLSGAHYVAPGDFAMIYDVNPLYSAGNTGKGVTIAVIGQTDILISDITDFRGASGLTANDPTVTTVPGTTPLTVAAGAASNDLSETDLDLEWSGGVATGASIVLVNSSDIFTSLAYAIQNPINGITIPIISQSYGTCEANIDMVNQNTIEGWLKQANSQGQTVVLASGDSGATDCDDTGVTSATLGLAVYYPGSSQYVTDAGGSSFMGDGTAQTPQTGAGTYWSANGSGSVSDDLITSAKSYIPEMGWNDTAFAIANKGTLSAGGGGVSALFPKPSWQTGVPGIPADSHRDVPDISLNSSPDHDPYLYCTQIQTMGSGSNFAPSCQATSFRLSDGNQSDTNNLTAAGGTSFAAPAFAGLLAILEQKFATGGGLGNVNPALYQLAANSTTYASAFHDITTGNNKQPCTTASTGCPSGSNPTIGYSAGTGYDQATGIGSIDANNLATAFGALLQAIGTKTVLTVTPGNSVEINQALTFTATVTANTPTTAPTGTVNFIVDNGTPTSVALSGTSPYTATFTDQFPQAGTHSVTAAFVSGNSTYTNSFSASQAITVVAQGTAMTTTTVTINPTSFPLGNSVTLAATVSGIPAGAGTLTGPMTFTTGGKTIGAVQQVTIGPGNSATASLTVNATASLGFAVGPDTITATYGGDAYNAGSSGTTTATVSNPGITLSATNMTISSPSPGNSGTSTVTVTSTGGYAGTAVLTASAATLNANYGFGSTGSQTANVALSSGGTGSTTITITTVAASGNIQKSPAGNFRKTAARIAAAGGTAAGCILLLLIPGIRRKRWPVALAMLVFLSVGAGMGCGGGGPAGAAPKGTYTVTISAADSSNANITGTTTFTVTIQ
jgi:subtilase family serine protease